MWENLSKTQKFIFITIMCCFAPFAPEFILMADIGGLELVFSFLVLYYKPFLMRLRALIEQIKSKIKNCTSAFKNSSIFQPKVYFTQALFYSCAFFLSGSILFASAFLLPAFLFNPVLV